MATGQSNVVLNFTTDGEVQYAKTLKDINTVMQTAAKEYQAHIAAMGQDADMTERLAAEKKKLDTQLAASTERVNMLREEYEAMAADTNTTAAELQKMYNKLLTAETAHAKLEQSMQRVNKGLTAEAIAARNAQSALDELNDAGSELESEQQKLISAFDLEAAQLGKNATEAEKSALAQRKLTAQMKLAEKAIANTEAQLEQAKIAYGENSNEVRRLETQLNQARITLIEFEDEMEDVSSSTEDAGESLDELGEKFQALAGIVAALGIGTVIASALSEADIDTAIDIRFNVPEESKESVRSALSDVQKYGVEGEDALKGIQRQWILNKDATDEMNRSVVMGAAALTKMFSDLSFSETIEEINGISDALGISSSAATDLTFRLLQIGLPPEQIGVISEYGGKLKELGYTVEGILDIFATASSSGTLDVEGMLGGLVEGLEKVSSFSEGLSDATKEGLRKVTGETKQATEEQLKVMQDGFDKKEKALNKSMAAQIKAVTQGHDEQKKILSKSLDAEYKAISKNYAQQESALEKSLGKVYDKTAKAMSQQQRALEKSLGAEMRAYEKATNAKLKLIDKEFLERLKLVDEERYNQLKALDARIEGIEAVTEAEDRALKKRQDAEKLDELRLNVKQARTAKERRGAIKALADFEEQLQMEAVREERAAEIKGLQAQKENVDEIADAKKESIQAEAEIYKESFKERREDEKEVLKERQDDQKEALKEQHATQLAAIAESHKAEVEALKELNGEKLESLKEEQDLRRNALNERLNDEMEIIKESHAEELESFKRMNAEKIEIAKTPIETAASTALFQQLEGWGNAIAQGGEKGAQAFKDMIKWLNEIEDETLRNTLGAEIFGDAWTEQGEEIVNALLESDGAFKDLEASQDSFLDGMKKINESPTTQIAHALEQIKEALAPLLVVIAKVVGAFAEFAASHPIIASGIVGIASAVGIAVAAFAALAPMISAVPALLSTVVKGFGLVKGAMAAVTGLLPMLGAAFSALLSPIGLVIAAVAAVAAAAFLIIKHWDPIKKFFAELWKTIGDIFSSAGKVLSDIMKKVWDSILNIVKGPLETMTKFITDNWDGIKRKTKEIWDGVYKAIKKPMEMARDVVKKMIDAIKGFFDFEFKWPKLKMPKFKVEGGHHTALAARKLVA